MSDFKFDQGYALAVLTGIHCVDEHEKTYELVVDSVTTIIADNVSKTRSAFKNSRTLFGVNGDEHAFRGICCRPPCREEALSFPRGLIERHHVNHGATSAALL